MASCSLGGITDLKVFKFCSGSQKIRYDARLMPCKMKCCHLETSFKSSGVQIIYGHVAAVTPPSRIINSLVVNCLPSEKENDGDNLDEKPLCNDTIVPASFKVQPLLTTICDTTSIAEFDLKVGGFRVYVKRDLVERSTPAPSPSLPPAQTSSSNETPDTNGSAVASSFAISKVKSTPSGIQSILETASDEGLVILQSPKVGFFRKSRTIKGKKAPPSCKEKQQVKEGQVLCYVEQLGGEIPIESDVSGEIIKILRTDGEPVGYGDALIAFLPSFPGIKKLQ